MGSRKAFCLFQWRRELSTLKATGKDPVERESLAVHKREGFTHLIGSILQERQNDREPKVHADGCSQ